MFNLAIIVIGLAVFGWLAFQFIWPRRLSAPSADTNWEQRNDLKSPSLDGFSAPQSLSDIAIAQDNDGDR